MQREAAPASFRTGKIKACPDVGAAVLDSRIGMKGVWTR